MNAAPRSSRTPARYQPGRSGSDGGCRVVTVSRGGYLKRTSVDTYQPPDCAAARAASAWARALKTLVEHLHHRFHSRLHAHIHQYGPCLLAEDCMRFQTPAPPARGSISPVLSRLQPDEVSEGLPGGEGIRSRANSSLWSPVSGVIKKCELSVFDNPLSRGIIALGLGRRR